MAARTIYTASGEALVGLNSSARVSMLSPDVRTGNTYFFVPANSLPVGAHIHVVGEGLIGAATAAPGAYNLVPWLKPSGGSSVDLPGFSVAPLLGADGTCTIWMKFTQTSSGIRTAGVISYGTQNGMHYTILVNAGTISTPPITVASDPTVDRQFGIDGFWATASTQNYVRCRQTTATLIGI